MQLLFPRILREKLVERNIRCDTLYMCVQSQATLPAAIAVAAARPRASASC